MGYGRQFFRHALFTTACTVLAGVLNYILRRVLFVSLSTEDFGLFYAVLSFSMVMHPVLTFGFDPGVVPYVTGFREKGDWAGAKNVIVGSLAVQLTLSTVVLGMVLVFASQIAVFVFDAPHAASVIRIIALYTWLQAPFRMFLCLLLGLQHIAARNLVQLGRVAAGLLLALVLLHQGHGIYAAAWAYAGSLVAGMLVEAVGMWRLCRKVVAARLEWRPDLVREVFSTGKYLAVAFGGLAVLAYMDTVMLTLVLRPDYVQAVAAYHLAVPAVMIFYGILFAIARNFMPMVATMWHRNEKALLAGGIGRMYGIAAGTVFPAAVLTACFSDVLIQLLFPGDIGNAPHAFAILVTGSVFFFVCFLNINILGSLNKTREACRAIVCAVSTNLVLNLVLIRYFDVKGAAAATVSSTIVGTVLSVIYIRRELAVKLRVSTLVAGAVAAGAGALICLLVRQSAFFESHKLLTAAISVPVLFACILAILELTGMSKLREFRRIVMPGTREAGEDPNEQD